MADAKATLTKKVGPAPLYVWAVVAVVGFYLFKHFSSTTTAQAGTLSPSSVDTSTTGTGTTGTPPSSGQGSAADNLNADLLSSLFGSAVDINSNLVSGLMNSNNAIAGLGSEALAQSGQLQQAIIQSYTPTAPSIVYVHDPSQTTTTTVSKSAVTGPPAPPDMTYYPPTSRGSGFGANKGAV